MWGRTRNSPELCRDSWRPQAIQEEGSLVDRNRDGVIQYVVLEGEAGHQDAIIRTEKAVDTLKSQGISLEKLSYGVANWNRAQAENRMTQMIGEHQNRIELVLANNDAMALGAMDAYRKLNITGSHLPGLFRNRRDQGRAAGDCGFPDGGNGIQ